MRLCLLEPATAGRLARALAAREDADVTVAVLAERPRPPAVAVDAAIAAGGFDVALALDWSCTVRLHDVPAAAHALWVEEVAHHAIGIWNAERIAARLAYDLPLDFVAASDAVAADLADLRPDARVVVAREGIDKAVFRAGDAAAGDGPLRVVAVRAPDDWDLGPGVRRLADGAPPEARADALRGADVVVVARPDERATLEAMHCGAVCVVVREGPVRHAVDGLVAEPDDALGVARWLEHLARDREWLAELRAAALEAAAARPSASAASDAFVATLAGLAAEPAPAMDGWPARLMAGALAEVAAHRADDALLSAELHRVQSDEAYVAVSAVRDRALASARLAGLRRLARPAVRAARGRLGG